MDGGTASTQSECRNLVTIGNFCQTFPWLDPSTSDPLGETIFVATSCEEKFTMGFCRQAQEYLLPGVSANVSVYDAYKAAHMNDDMSQPVSSTATYMCDNSIGEYNEGNPIPGENGPTSSYIPVQTAIGT